MRSVLLYNKEKSEIMVVFSATESLMFYEHSDEIREMVWDHIDERLAERDERLHDDNFEGPII